MEKPALSSALRIAANYLVCPTDAFWTWQDQGDTIAWVDGRTIAFRSELAQVLAHLAPDGLPPLGAVLLLMAATRDNWVEDPSDLTILADCLKHSDKANVETLYDVIEGLIKVHRLEPELRSTPEAKALLAELVFEGRPGRTSPADAAIIVQYAFHGIREVISEPTDRWNLSIHGPRVLCHELSCLQPGLDRVDPEVLRLRGQTGLDQLPDSFKIDLSPNEIVRTLLAELENDDELGGLARLALNLMAAVTVPRPVVDREELQVGGVSDISNRGPVDRLLLSELAHDDLTLAVRIAVNEALYTRRESPPRTPPRERTLLLDVGIRSWGVPRVFATAVALAMAATCERKTKIAAYRAKGNRVEPVDLTTRAGIVAHLGALESDLHPGPALDAFQAEMAAAEGIADPILVTTDDVMDDHEFQRLLADSRALPLHVATVNRDGRFCLLEKTARGTKPVKEAMLGLEELFQGAPGIPSTLIDRTRRADLPEIFSVVPFPLLLSHELDHERAWSVERRGVLALTRDRRLMFWTDENRGAQQIADDIPRGTLWWSSHEPTSDIVRAVVGQKSSDGDNYDGLHLLEIDLANHCCSARRLDIDARVWGIISHNGALFAQSYRQMWVISEKTGDILQTLKVSRHLSSRGGRFFSFWHFGKQSDDWQALAFDGESARFEPVFSDPEADASPSERPRLLTLYDRAGVDGPIGITEQGDLYFTATAELRKVEHGLPGDVRVIGISPGGRRVVLASSRDTPAGFRPYAEVDTDTLAVEHHYANYWEHVVLDRTHLYDCVSTRALRHRFKHIFVDSHGVLMLTSRRPANWGIEFDSSRDDIVLRLKAGPSDFSQKPSFDVVRNRLDVGYRLARATWTDGSAALLDSRGLLHLNSSNQAIPEVTIVLKDGALSGWCSDGRMWGERYFIGTENRTSAREIFDTVIKPFVEQLR